MNFLPANRLRIYRDFKAMDTHDFHGVVRYYEQYEDGIRALDFEEYFDCTLAYTHALFETGNHGKHLVMCDHLLEIVIMQNIGTWGGEDVYNKLLFKKAASLFRQHEYGLAEYVLRELLKIRPCDKPARRFLQKCLYRQKPTWLLQTRAACVLLSLLAAGIIALELFVVKPFFAVWLKAVQIAHNLFLVAALTVFAVGETLHYWYCRGAATSFATKMKRRKSVA